MIRLALLAVVISGNTLAELSCSGKQGHTAFAKDSSCYEFNSYAQTWVGSRDSCHAQGGRLAKVSSADLQNWLSARASEQFPSTNVWIGLSDRASQNAYVWDEYDGGNTDTISYSNWNSGQPWHGNNNDMNCVQMMATSGYTWRLYSCQWFFVRIYPSICEYRLETSLPVPSIVTIPTTSSSLKTTREIHTSSNTSILPSMSAASTMPTPTISPATLTAAHVSSTMQSNTTSPAQTVTSTGNILTDMSCSGKQGYTAFAKDSSCFEFNSNAQTWVGSRDSCHGKGGRLAKVSSADLQIWLSARASEQFPSTNVWIGLSDRWQSNAYMWDEYDGGNVDTGNYSNWNSDQPWHGNNNDMNCVQMMATSGYTWRLYSCQWFFIRIYPSICEYRLESSQSSAMLSPAVSTAASFLTQEASYVYRTNHTDSSLHVWLPITIVIATVIIVAALAVMIVRRRRRIPQQSRTVPFGYATSIAQHTAKENALSKVTMHGESMYSTLRDVKDERQYDFVSADKVPYT